MTATLADRLKLKAAHEQARAAGSATAWPWCTACIRAGEMLEGHRHARADQLAPPGDWRIWILRAGRGFGKTRTAAEWMIERRLHWPNTRGIVCMPTFDEAKRVAIEGESGIVPCLERRGLVEDKDFTWNRTSLEVRFANGSRIECFTGERPKKLRGPQSHDIWIDEPASFPDQAAEVGQDRGPFAVWSNARFGHRLRYPDGSPNRIIVTGTPRRVPFIRMLEDMHRDNPERVILTRGRSVDNLANLNDSYQELIDEYSGTALGSQELNGDLLDDVEGAMWMQATIDASRVESTPALIASLNRIIVAVDPAASDSPTSDEVGIIGVGATGQQVYVLGDWSRRGMPDVWAHTVVDAVVELGAQAIVMESNLVGGWMTSTIQSALDARSVRCQIIGVHAGAGQTKAVRAEPVSMLYSGERPRVHHVGFLPKVEDEMTTWVPGQTKRSPNRIDALVWGVLELTKQILPSGLVAPPRREGARAVSWFGNKG